jgi:competence protein ComEA
MKIRGFRELFIFSKKERKGVVSLLLVIFLLIVIGKLIPLFVHHDKGSFTEWENEVNTYLAKTEGNIPVGTIPNLVAFDPNKVDSVILIKMGVPEKVVSNWVKYLGKGGRFRKNDEVKKIFGMTPGLFGRLDSLMVIRADKAANIKTAGRVKVVSPRDGLISDTVRRRIYPKSDKAVVKVQELNSTDSLHLLEITGIGPVFASRIVRYRNLLGGFYAVSQLREVYGLKEENFKIVSQFFTVEPSVIKKININFSTVQELGRHPYIGYKTARKVIKLRDKTGKFTSAGDLSLVTSADSLNKMAPYLNFSQ